MKFIHLSDLHLGKRLNEYSLLKDQEYILEKIRGIVIDEKPDGVLIAGDVYDKSVPSAEAVQLFDRFLTELSEIPVRVFVISGNHDSPERMSFGSRLLDKSGIYLSKVYGDKTVEAITLSDEYGKVNVYLLPFVKPIHVRQVYPEETVESYTDAMRVAIDRMAIDPIDRNLLVTHQFVTGALRCDSEEISVGGSDSVDVSVFDAFDYVALGHIHGPQNCSFERVRYCGTPLKYSFSEADDQKSVTVIELARKGELTVRTVPLVPFRDMVKIKGTYNEIINLHFYEGTTWQKDYTAITLTDEEDIVDAVGKLRAVYHHLMKLDYDNKRTRHSAEISGSDDVEKKSPLTLFSDFYELQNNQPMSEEQKAYVGDLIEKIWEEEV